MLSYILGPIPYAAMGVIMSTIGYNYTTWQFYAITACMLVSDAISTFRQMCR